MLVREGLGVPAEEVVEDAARVLLCASTQAGGGEGGEGAGGVGGVTAAAVAAVVAGVAEGLADYEPPREAVGEALMRACVRYVKYGHDQP